MAKILKIPTAPAKTYTELPFGKWRGYTLEDIPNSYLEWCLDSCDIVRDNPDLKESVKTRLMLGLHVEDYEP